MKETLEIKLVGIKGKKIEVVKYLITLLNIDILQAKEKMDEIPTVITVPSSKATVVFANLKDLGVEFEISEGFESKDERQCDIKILPVSHVERFDSKITTDNVEVAMRISYDMFKNTFIFQIGGHQLMSIEDIQIAIEEYTCRIKGLQQGLRDIIVFKDNDTVN